MAGLGTYLAPAYLPGQSIAWWVDCWGRAHATWQPCVAPVPLLLCFYCGKAVKR